LDCNDNYALYCNFYYLVVIARRQKKNNSITFKEIPTVTIQLPIYNEKYVASRLVNAVCALDYPKDKLCIQVLDDSTDETYDLLENLVSITSKRDLTYSMCEGQTGRDTRQAHFETQ
jgi:Glycosyltransferases, probably involved in cell wall biogenesis